MASTLLAPQPLPPNTPNPAPTDSIVDIQAFLALSAQNEAYIANQKAASAYLTFQFPNWLANYERLNVPGATPPDPPSGAMVDVSNPWNPEFLYIGPPVCAIPAYTPIAVPAPPGTVAIGSHDAGLYWNCLIADSAPGGYIAHATSQDGITGVWERIVYPFGGWWQLISTSPSTPYPGVPVTV
jgi:hypothetical protein